MTDGVLYGCVGLAWVALVIWLVTYLHFLRERARTLAEVRRLNAEWRNDVAEWHAAVAEWHALLERGEV